MKRLSIISITIFMLFALIGCGQQDDTTDYGQNISSGTSGEISVSEAVSPGHGQAPAVHGIPDHLTFWSLEEFLYAHRAVREGTATGRLAEMAASIDFESLEELVLPNNLPGIYQIHQIEVYDTAIWVWFLPEGSLASEEARWDAGINRTYFLLRTTRWTYEDLESWGVQSPMDGIMRQDNATEDDLIDGTYHFNERTNTIYWARGSNRLSFHLPNTLPANQSTIHDLLPLTQTTTIDLLDEDLITELIGDFYQLDFNLGTFAGNTAASSAFPPILIPSGANIHNFITTNHEEIPIYNPTRRGHYFLGWYLDADFTIPLIRPLTLMPARDTTLYARWQLR